MLVITLTVTAAIAVTVTVTQAAQSNGKAGRKTARISLTLGTQLGFKQQAAATPYRLPAKRITTADLVPPVQFAWMASSLSPTILPSRMNDGSA